MKRYGKPHSIVTDKIPSYKAAMKETGNSLKPVVAGAIKGWLEFV